MTDEGRGVARSGISRWLMIALGLVVVLLGLLTFWLPLPVGLPLMLLGTPILLRHSRLARRLAASMGRRHPALKRLLRRRRPARRPLDAEGD
jgi:hypothetical protein